MAAADLVEGLRLTPLVAPSSQQIVFSQLRAVWNLPGGAHTMYIHNPAPQPSSMFRSQLSELMRPDAPRLATLKANGTRFQLMMTLNAARAPIACFANRKLDLYDVRVRARADFYNGTVLDGELLQLPTPAKAVNGGAPVVAVFLVFDMYQCAGQRTTDLPFLDRFERATQTVAEIASITPGLRIEMKPVLPIADAPRLYRMARDGSAECKADGLVLPLKDAIVTPQTDLNMWKIKLSHTVDLNAQLIRRSDGTVATALFCVQQRENLDVLKGFAMDPHAYRLASHADTALSRPAGVPEFVRPRIATEHALWKALVQEFLKTSELVRMVLIEWDVSVPNKEAPDELLLRPVMLRTDKTLPNTAWTTYATFCNAMEAITLEDLERALNPEAQQPATKRKRPVASQFF